MLFTARLLPAIAADFDCEIVDDIRLNHVYGQRDNTDRAVESNVEVYRRLREDIISGRFQPNERLVEADLERALGAGRTTIRAALVRLDQEGLVERHPHRGARVRLVSDREALEIEEVRAALEQLIVRHAASQATDADLDDMRGILAEMRTLVEQGDAFGYSELNSRFHQRIWTIAGHSTANRLVATLKSQSLRYQYRTILQPGRTQRSLDEHAAIVEALGERDPDAAETAMRDHLRHVVETLRWSIERQHGRQPWQPE
jgi:DNA-binding GntR family transcriptional regulator